METQIKLMKLEMDKEETMVLDFANEADEIQRSFEPYFEATLLSEATAEPVNDFETHRRH